MNIHWAGIPFRHNCGMDGTILGVCGSQDGCLAITGVCILCTRHFTVEYTFAGIIANCVINDLELSNNEEEGLQFPKEGEVMH